MHFKILESNLGNYERAKKEFNWDSHWKELLGESLSDFVNLAELSVDRPVRMGLKDHLALRHLNKQGEVRDYGYGELKEVSEAVAAGLQSLGLYQKDTVFCLLGRVPELYFTALGALKAGMVFSPLFSSFGPIPIRTRLNIGSARALVTTRALYQKGVESIRHEVPSLQTVILVDATPEQAKAIHCISWSEVISQKKNSFSPVKTKLSDPALLHFTSGTTGRPKGVSHVHGAAVMHYVSGKYALDFHRDDVFWCTADPGWVTGTSYGIFSPWLNGVTSVIDECEFDPKHWYQTLQNQQITVWYTSPTAIRMLMKAGSELMKEYDLSSLRLVGSVGEPLNPEAVLWGQENLGVPVLDNWWQTETGGIMISNFRGQKVKPGSMGLPLPGIEVILVEQRRNGEVHELKKPNQLGEIAIRAGWPSMFQAYLGEEGRYQRSFSHGFYLTGDLAKKDEEGYFWFVGRLDDVIKSSGHLIGPFEVESVLMEHPAVAEAAVIGVPDPIAMETVKAFVCLKAGVKESEALQFELMAHARKRLGAVIAPKSISFLSEIPHTRSGKTMRRLLRARELGLPEGDLSTLEGPS